MKITIKTEKKVKILSVSESVTLKDFSVLQNGLQKLFGKEKHIFFINWTQATLEADCYKQLPILEAGAIGSGNRVIFISPDKKIGHVPTMEAALQCITSKLFLYQQSYRALKLYLQLIQHEREKVIQKKKTLIEEKKLTISKLKEEFKKLLFLCKHIEHILNSLYNTYQPPIKYKKLKTLQESIEDALYQEHFISHEQML